MVTPPKSPRAPTSLCTFSLLLPRGTTSRRFFYHCEIQDYGHGEEVSERQYRVMLQGYKARPKRFCGLPVYERLPERVWINRPRSASS